MLGAESAADMTLLGIGIDIFDNAGLSYAQVTDVALDVVLQSGRSNETVVNLIWDNLVVGPIPQDLLNQLTGDLARGAFSQVELAVVASELVQELGVVDLDQLTLVGVEYTPVA
ncbi:MAG: hypothetical protein R3F50_04585 [Gammaproteobacteria bacterium]